jgi:hypothetical protein
MGKKTKKINWERTGKDKTVEDNGKTEKKKKTAKDVREEKIRKIKGFIFNFILRENEERVQNLPFRKLLDYAIDTFKLGTVSRSDYDRLWEYYHKIKKNRNKHLEEKRLAEEILLQLYRKVQTGEITADFARQFLETVKQYLGRDKYREWRRIFVSFKKSQ